MNLVKVKLINDNTEFHVPPGEKIMDHLPDSCTLMFGCKKGQCGTCICTIRSGEHMLVSKSQTEEETIRNAGGSPNQRLCCQLWVKQEIVKEEEIEMEY